MSKKTSKLATPFFLTFNGKRISASPTPSACSEDIIFSLNNEDIHISEKKDPEVIKTRLKNQLEVISGSIILCIIRFGKILSNIYL
jgi:hypothetical protein